MDFPSLLHFSIRASITSIPAIFSFTGDLTILEANTVPNPSGIIIVFSEVKLFKSLLSLSPL
jgi:hypothetical protein